VSIDVSGLPPDAGGSSERELTVLLADENTVTRAGVRRALAPHGLRVVAEADNARDAVALARRHRPEICLLAVRMPGNGIEAAQQINAELPDTKIVMLTASEKEGDLFASLRAGADGYLLMNTSSERLAHALRGVVNGQAALPRTLTARLIREFRAPDRRRALPASVADQGVDLTTREFEVLERLRRDESTAEIAAGLGISEITVRRHVSAVVRKLGVANRRSALELLEREERRDSEPDGRA
jgi:DNA-binding NarL/FixJ family response regulator